MNEDWDIFLKFIGEVISLVFKNNKKNQNNLRILRLGENLGIPIKKGVLQLAK